MKEKTTKYTNIISVFFILFSAIIFFFQLPSNQINIPSTDFSMLYYMMGIISFLVLFVIVLFYLPMLFIIKVSYNVQLSYIDNNRFEVSYYLPELCYVNRKTYQKLCVVRC
jgi:hypothetical protein